MKQKINVRNILTMSALGLILASQVTLAQDSYGDRGASQMDHPMNSQELGFNEADANNDNAVEWVEINTIYSNELADIGWEEEEVFNQFDQNQDDILDESEYVLFVSGLTNAQPNRNVAATENRQTQQMNQQDQMAQQNRMNQQDQMAQQNQQGQQSQQNDLVDAVLVAVTTVREVPVASLEDRQVINIEGENIGEVEDVVVSTIGNQTGLVVGVGGFWDIGDKDIFVSLDQIRLTGEEIVWETAADGELLQELPAYNARDYVSLR